MAINKIILSLPFVKSWKAAQQKKKFKGSAAYWEERYQQKGNSGGGSYTHLAEHKADVINCFVKQEQIQTVTEFGCGDGNQLTLASYPFYTGLDVSPTAVKICQEKFGNDTTKQFFVFDGSDVSQLKAYTADLTMSLDVLYHLVEKEVFESYLLNLFSCSRKYVLIYASDFDQVEDPLYRHENRRKFTGFIAQHIPGWELKEVIKNKYPTSQHGDKGSLSDFYIYRKTA